MKPRPTAFPRETANGHPPDLIATDHNALIRWMNKDVQSAIDDSSIPALLLELAAPEASVRHEALIAVRKLAAQLRASSHAEKEQLWLLLRELLLVAGSLVDAGAPVPGFLVAFAAAGVGVQASPAHELYAKLNAFLLREVRWDVDKVPLLHGVLRGPPAGEAWYLEVEWMLDVLCVGARSVADVEVYWRRGVFQELMSLYASSYLPENLQAKILCLMFCTADAGGALLLVKRCAITGWIKAQLALRPTSPNASELRRLAGRLLEAGGRSSAGDANWDIYKELLVSVKDA
ncbi:MAG: hypothetical protein M1829_003562 [Trizodia sp. TS-e1964]|nr:MAG: hypothetical protein M1829_003562 [Trizodia sp. TS-e1964]